jgi:uncharacterized metal-binding protein YceD (DUF177 family)
VKILFEDIPPHGINVRADLAKDWAAAAAEKSLGSAPTALALVLFVERTGRHELEVTGTLSATALARCGRCLADVSLSLGGDVKLHYTTPEQGADSDTNRDLRVGVDDEALDVGWFDGVCLDMADVVSEQLALWEPPRLVCDAPGVTRLEDGTCQPITYDSGPEVKRPSPFAKLAGLKLPK